MSKRHKYDIKRQEMRGIMDQDGPAIHCHARGTIKEIVEINIEIELIMKDLIINDGIVERKE